MGERMNPPGDKKNLSYCLERLPVTPENVKRMAEEYLRVTDPDIKERIEDFLFFKVFREDSTLFEEWDKVCAAPVISVWGEISEELLKKIIRTIPGVDNLTLLFDYSPFLQKNIEEKKHIRDAYVERIMGSGEEDHVAQALQMLDQSGKFLDEEQLAECVRKVVLNRKGSCCKGWRTEKALVDNWKYMSQPLREEVIRTVTSRESLAAVVSFFSNADLEVKIGEDVVLELLNSILLREDLEIDVACSLLDPDQTFLPANMKEYFAAGVVSNLHKIFLVDSRGEGFFSHIDNWKDFGKLTNLLPAGHKRAVVEFILEKAEPANDDRDCIYLRSLNPDAVWESWDIIRGNLFDGRWVNEVRNEIMQLHACKSILVAREIIDPSDFRLVWGDSGGELVLLILGTACSRTFDSDDCMERMMRNVVSAFCPERGGPLRYEVQEDWIGNGGKSSIKFFNRVHQYLADKGDGETFLLAKDFLSTLSDAIREETMSPPVRETYERLCTLIQTMENERMCAVKELLPTDGIL